MSENNKTSLNKEEVSLLCHHLTLSFSSYPFWGGVEPPTNGSQLTVLFHHQDQAAMQNQAEPVKEKVAKEVEDLEEEEEEEEEESGSEYDSDDEGESDEEDDYSDDYSDDEEGEEMKAGGFLSASNSGYFRIAYCFVFLFRDSFFSFTSLSLI